MQRIVATWLELQWTETTFPEPTGKTLDVPPHRVRQTLALAGNLFIPFTENDAFPGLGIR